MPARRRRARARTRGRTAPVRSAGAHRSPARARARTGKLEFVGRLAGGLGHELRNPLGNIRNAVYYLRLTHPDLDRTTRRYLDIVDGETTRAVRIIENLLTFARVRPPQTRPASLVDIIARGREHVLFPDQVQVRVDVPLTLPPALVDPDQLAHAFENIMLNAIQAMADGGTLTIGARRQADRLVVSFQDTGVGILPGSRRHIFDPFFATGTSGLGLGLAVSRSLIEANGGRISVASNPGQGTLVTVVLPAAATP